MVEFSSLLLLNSLSLKGPLGVQCPLLVVLVLPVVPPVTPPPTPAQSEEGRALLDMRKGLIQYHHDLVRMCAKVGIPDVWPKYKETRVENILKGLSSDDLSCRICKKPYSNTPHLRNHMKMKHLKKTPFYCAICKKYFTDQSTLNDHNRKHDPDAKKYKCMQCTKEFFSKSKLKAHEPVHSGPSFVCQYCNKKTFYYKAGVQEHEKKCEENADCVERSSL